MIPKNHNATIQLYIDELIETLSEIYFADMTWEEKLVSVQDFLKRSENVYNIINKSIKRLELEQVDEIKQLTDIS